MKTIKTVEITPIFCGNDVPDLPSEYKELDIYVSKNQKRIAFNCLCGCGAFVMLPVNQKEGGWNLEIDDNKRLTLIGSVLQYSCKAHYVITKNKANFI